MLLCVEMVPYRLHHIISPCQDIGIPEPQNVESFAVQETCSPGIAVQPCWGVVLPAVDLDDKLSFKTCKVDNIGADTVLAAKVPAKPVATQPAPQPYLGLGHIAS